MKHCMSAESISIREMDIKTKEFVWNIEQPHWYDINSLQE